LVNKYKNAESQLNVLQQENNALKLEQTKTNSVLAKLNQERDDNERKHGQRTALVGMLEEQVADLNDSLSETKAKLEATSYDISQKDEEIESLKKDLEKTESALKNAESKAAESAAAAQQNTQKDSIQKSKTIKSLQAQVENLSSQMKKKSAAAQKILKEREAECIELRKTNKYLQNEVDKGSLSDRRIFELAEQQSNRETAAVAEIEIRERQIAHLTQQLEKHDANLATAEIDKEKAEDQVESLARVHRREGVNMDYLKSIVVQYLAKPPGSSERTALLPVLATLLQFDDNDYKAIEEGKQKVSWWGDIIPTYIGGSEAPTPAPRLPHPASVMPTSAEVTISNTLSQNVPKTTSLQF
jgi:chromosome segregation ATPase